MDALSFLDPVVVAIREQHGKELNLADETYYLQTNDGIVMIQIDEGELKVDIKQHKEGTVFMYEDKSISIVELMIKGGGCNAGGIRRT